MTGTLASTALAGLLNGPARTATLLGTSDAQVVLQAGTEVVTVTASRRALLPTAVVVDPAVLASVRRSDRVRMGDGMLDAGGVRLPVTEWWDPRPAAGTLPVTAAGRLSQTLKAPPTAVGADPWAAAVARGVAGLRAALRGDGPVSGAVAGLLGLGPGSTPAGDDVLLGALAAVVVLLPGPAGPAPVAQDLRYAVEGALEGPPRTTALSAALLRHAARGAVAAPVGALLTALAAGAALAGPLAAVLGMGGTSGRHLAEGVAAGVEALSSAAMVPDGEHRTAW